VSADERVDVVDEHDRVLRTVTRREIREGNLLHRSVYILVFNSAAALFVHRRTASKDVFPGFWDVAVGGVVGAGEAYDEAASRELDEEIGVAGVPLRSLFRMRYEDDSSRVLGRVYACGWNAALRLQRSEIDAGEWVAPAAPLQERQGRRYCPDGLQALRRYLYECGGEERVPGAASRL
jgi:isopentenyldiphosphate isomerase